MSGGGVSLLIIALVASFCLITLSACVVDNNHDDGAGVAGAATEIVDGHEYAVLDVYGNTSFATLNEFFQNNKYAKLVLKENVACNNYNSDFYCNSSSIIIDLNGYNFQSRGTGFNCQSLQIMDSSAAGTGSLTFGMAYSYCRTFILHSGTITDNFALGTDSSKTLQCYIYGGNIEETIYFQGYSNNFIYFCMLGGSVGCVLNESIFTDYNIEINLAPCVSGDLTTRFAGDYYFLATDLIAADYYYAVSTTDLISGAYNYAYGYAWELTAAELSRLEVPSDKTYYLWGRNKDGWYEYLDLCYVNGELI